MNLRRSQKSGESEIAYCDKCSMAATTERAECVDAPCSDEAMLPLEEVHTPGTKTIEEVAQFLGLDQTKTIKALLFVVRDDESGEEGYVAAFIRGDRELNMIKLVNALKIPEHAIEFADEAKMSQATGCVGGFTGPMGLCNCKIVVDSELTGLKNLCAGANKEDHHVKNVNYGRDYEGGYRHRYKDAERRRSLPCMRRPCKACPRYRSGAGVQAGNQVFSVHERCL